MAFLYNLAVCLLGEYQAAGRMSIRDQLLKVNDRRKPGLAESIASIKQPPK